MSDAAGEDRSNYQAIGPWKQNFGMCKATESVNFQDPTFAQNWENLKTAGIPRAAYHFFHPAVNASDQAKYFVDYVKAHGLEEGDGLAIDAEITVGGAGVEVMGTKMAASPRMHVPPVTLSAAGAQCRHDTLPMPVYGATQWCEHCQQYCGGTDPQGQAVNCSGCASAKAALSAGYSLETPVTAFLEEVAALAGPHCPLLVYTYADLAASAFGSALADKYPDLWIAEYGVSAPSTGPWKTWRFWQTEGGGAPGGGDKDTYNGDDTQLRDWVNTYRTTPKPPPKPVIPAWQTAIIARLPELREGAKDEGGKTDWVKQAQLLVDIVGAGNVTADGDFGTETLTAVDETQRSRSLEPVDGIIGPATWQVLIASQPHNVLPSRVTPGTKDGTGVWWVHRIQACLDAHGEPTGIDGDFGPATETGVKAVQKAYGEPETGEVDETTWSLLIAHAKP